MRQIGHFIDGKRVAGTSGRKQPVFNPATGEIQAEVTLASDAELNAAVASAKAAQPKWAAANPQYAQVSVAAGPGCGLVLIGYLELTTGQRDTDAECGPYARDFVPAKAVELQPDVVMVMTTVWDVLDRRLTKDGPLLPATDPAVEAAMVASLGEFTDRLLALGVPRVVWVDGPVPLGSLVGGDDSQAQPARHATLHRAVASVAATRPAVRQLSA